MHTHVTYLQQWYSGIYLTDHACHSPVLTPCTYILLLLQHTHHHLCLSVCAGCHRAVVLSGECGQQSVVETALEVCLSTLERGEGTQVDVDSINNRIKSEYICSSSYIIQSSSNCPLSRGSPLLGCVLYWNVVQAGSYSSGTPPESDALFSSGSLGLPDPELVVVFGPICSTVGYPPWQLRLTEIQ